MSVLVLKDQHITSLVLSPASSKVRKVAERGRLGYMSASEYSEEFSAKDEDLYTEYAILLDSVRSTLQSFLFEQ